MNSLLEKIKNFFNDSKKIRMLFIAIIVLGIGGLLVSGYLVYQEKRENHLSLMVNEKIKFKNEVAEQWSQEELSGEDYTNQMAILADELFQIYQDNLGTKNGIRALISSAQIDFRLNNATTEEKLQTVIDEGEEMAPLALYLISLFYENQGNYLQALNTLQRFREDYIIHYLKPIVMLTEARLYHLMDQRDQAVGIYSEILQNQDFSLFFDRAEEGISILEWERSRGIQRLDEKKSGGSKNEDFVPGFGTGFEPEYLQTNN